MPEAYSFTQHLTHNICMYYTRPATATSAEVRDTFEKIQSQFTIVSKQKGEDVYDAPAAMRTT